jgi:hypothetical protein
LDSKSIERTCIMYTMKNWKTRSLNPNRNESPPNKAIENVKMPVI